MEEWRRVLLTPIPSPNGHRSLHIHFIVCLGHESWDSGEVQRGIFIFTRSFPFARLLKGRDFKNAPSLSTLNADLGSVLNQMGLRFFLFFFCLFFDKVLNHRYYLVVGCLRFKRLPVSLTITDSGEHRRRGPLKKKNWSFALW